MCEFLFWPNVCHNSSFLFFQRKKESKIMFLCARNFICLVHAYVVQFFQVYVMLPVMCYVFLFVLMNDCVLFNLFSGSRANCFVVLTDRDVHS